MRSVISTPRLVLRPLAITDAPAISNWAGDYDVARMTGSFPHPFPLLSAEIKVMMLKALRTRGHAYPYAVTVNNGPLMGMVDIFRRSSGFPFELGYWLGRPFWGQGYAVEASAALMTEARESLGLKEIIAGVFHDNAGSVRVLEKLGFEPVGAGDEYFSIARLKKAKSLDFHLSLNRLIPQTPCAAA